MLLEVTFGGDGQGRLKFSFYIILDYKPFITKTFRIFSSPISPGLPCLPQDPMEPRSTIRNIILGPGYYLYHKTNYANMSSFISQKIPLTSILRFYFC